MVIQTKLAQAKVHFIGIGGIGMCGLAELLHNMGATVTGSDSNENIQTQRLTQMGVPVFLGHDPSNLGEAEVVVYSSAVKSENPEYKEALARRIPLIRRAEALAEIMRLKRGVAIGGTHGKTTTTSLTASIFLHAQMDPTIVVGGRLDVIKSTAQLGQGQWLIAEADESDGSFLRLSPELVIITNIDNDHLDHYGSLDRLKEAFYDFAQRIPFYGAIIVCGDDPTIRTVFADFPKRTIFYGVGEHNQVQLLTKSQVEGRYALSSEGHVWAEFHLPLPGQHNALNATAAILAAKEAGVSISTACEAVSHFKGVDRRFQFKAKIRGIDFYDDYGHHPTEVEAVLNGFKERFPMRRLVVIFQPHRYSRTQICWQQFRSCFKRADLLFLMDIYPAGETPITGVTSQILAQEIENKNCYYIQRSENMNLQSVDPQLKEGDVVVTLGAGDIVKMGERLMESIAKS